MKRLYFSCILSVVMLFSCNNSFAAFGLGPCCPPSVCGTIPCDSGCAGQALIQMGSGVSAALSSLQQAYEQQTEAIDDAAESVRSLSQDLIESLDDTNQEYLKGLDASTSRIESSIASYIPVKEGLSNHKITYIGQVVQQYFAARSAAETARDIGPMGQPISGVIAANRARNLKGIIVRANQLVENNVRDFFAYQSNGAIHDGGSSSMLTSLIERDLTILNSPTSFLASTVLTVPEEEGYQRLFSYMTSIAPSKITSASGAINSEADIINEKRRAAINTIVFDAFAMSLKYRIAIGEYNWGAGYEDMRVNSEGDTSLYEVLRSDTEDRLNNAEWWGAVKRSSKSGLNRELVYLNGTNGVIRSLEFDVKRKSSMLTSLLLLSKL